jgi:hypothetical protein
VLLALLMSLWVGPLVALLIAVIGQVRRQGDGCSSRAACRWRLVSR